MHSNPANLISLVREPPNTDPGVRVGKIVRINKDKEVFVEFPGQQENRPVQARILSGALDNIPAETLPGVDALLVFENGDPCLPIVVGIVRDNLHPRPGEYAFQADSDKPGEIVVGKKKIVLEAREDITLRCGKSSIKMSKNGKVIVKGVEIVSRASRANKVKGGVVAIN